MSLNIMVSTGTCQFLLNLVIGAILFLSARMQGALLVAVSRADCDKSWSTAPKEGNVGESALFQWLGVLRVHIHQGETFKVALTGLVLVKEGFAIANADDVARIPKRIFQEDSRAMFIPKENAPWFCRLIDYMTHPEYEYSTMNSIALLELDPGEGRSFPMKPICWPPYSYNTSNQLYAIGFTDDNKLLEKTIYSLQYVEQTLCQEFYNRAGLMESKFEPAHYQCAFAKNNKDNCVWDNGVVLAANSTKLWTLIGFGVRGPGCAAPARFIDLQLYLPWVESATNLQDLDEHIYRKTAFNQGFRKKMPEDDEIGISPVLTDIIQNTYPFDTEVMQTQYFSIDRIDKDAINIRNVSLPAEDGACDDRRNILIYKDETKVLAQDEEGHISYRLSMYDLSYFNYSCVKIWLKAKCQDKATLYYTAKIDNKEGTAFAQFGDTPEEVLKTSLIHPVTLKPDVTPDKDPADWEPGPHLKVKFIEDKDPVIRMENYNIYLRFEFEDEGILNIEILGPPPLLTTSTTTTEKPIDRAGPEIPEEINGHSVPAKPKKIEVDEMYGEFNGTWNASQTSSGERLLESRESRESSELLDFATEPPTSAELIKSLIVKKLVSGVEKIGGVALKEAIALEMILVWFFYYV